MMKGIMGRDSWESGLKSYTEIFKPTSLLSATISIISTYQ
jgi:hypothetical protein